MSLSRPTSRRRVPLLPGGGAHNLHSTWRPPGRARAALPSHLNPLSDISQTYPARHASHTPPAIPASAATHRLLPRRTPCVHRPQAGNKTRTLTSAPLCVSPAQTTTTTTTLVTCRVTRLLLSGSAASVWEERVDSWIWGRAASAASPTANTAQRGGCRWRLAQQQRQWRGRRPPPPRPCAGLVPWPRCGEGLYTDTSFSRQLCDPVERPQLRTPPATRPDSRPQAPPDARDPSRSSRPA